MALPPTLVRSTEDGLQVNASFSNGRYRFSLTSAGKSLLCDDLELDDGATVPLTAFKILVVVGDAYLPNASGNGVDIANDLAQVENGQKLSNEDALAIAAYLERGSYRDRELEWLSTIVPDSPLATHVSVDTLESKRNTVNTLRDIAAQFDDPSSPTDRNEPVQILHVGTTTLGRRNLQQSERRADYLYAFSQAVDVAVETDVDAVIQTGRLFQRSSPHRRTIRDTREQLDRLQERDIPFYVTHSSKDPSSLDDRAPDLIDEGLIEPLGGRTVAVDDDGTVCIHGVDAGLPHDQRTPAWDEATGAEPAFAGVVVEAADHPGTESVGVIDASIDGSPDAYFVGGIDERVDTTYGSTPVLGPGPTENTLGKRTVTGDDPPDRFVTLYTIEEGSVDITVHELEVRDYTSLMVECTTETDIEALESKLSDADIRDAATLVVLVGEKHKKSPSTEMVSAILEDEAFCVRVWDERNECSISTEEAEKDDQTAGPDPVQSDLTASSSTVLCVADLLLRGSEVLELKLVLDIAEAHAIDAVVHTGDLFATASPEKETIQAVEDTLARVRDGSLRFCTIDGRRTVAGETNALEQLEHAGVERLDTDPTDVGSIAIYGVNHVPSDIVSHLRDQEFTWASYSSHCICCLNQSIWPAVSDNWRADVAAYDVVNAVKPYLKAIVAGGTSDNYEWRRDDLVVTYPGAANPERLTNDRTVPTGIVFAGSNDRPLRYASIPITEQTLIDPDPIDTDWRVLDRKGPDDDTRAESGLTEDLEADPNFMAGTSTSIDTQSNEPLDAVRQIAATDWEVDPDVLDTTDLIDYYGILSKARSDLERQRQAVRDALISRTDPEKALTGQYASVDHTERTRRTLRDSDTVLNAIEQAGIAQADVQSPDVSKAREAFEETGRSFDDTLTTMLDRAGVDPDDTMSLDSEKVEQVVEESDIDPEEVFENETKAKIVRKSLEFPSEE